VWGWWVRLSDYNVCLHNMTEGRTPFLCPHEFSLHMLSRPAAKLRRAPRSLHVEVQAHALVSC
jgi:hypothetical protein